MQMKFYTYTVEGTGEFPIDMLRQDACWPATPEDSLAIGGGRDWTVRRTVKLYSWAEPAQQRWASFGWRLGEALND